MTSQRIRARVPTRVAGCALTIGLALFASMAHAERPAHAPRGDYTRHTERARTENGHVRRDQWSNAEGKSVTRDAAVANDREAGTRTRDVTWTGPEGRRAMREDVTKRTEDGYTRSTVVVNPSGASVTRNVDAVYDPQTRTVTRDVEVVREPPAAP